MPLTDFFTTGKSRFFISRAEIEDAVECARIHKSSFFEPWDENVLAKLMAARQTEVIIATNQGRPYRPGSHRPICAFLIYRVAGEEAEILTIATDPVYRSKGIARLLLDEMIRQCLTNRMEEIFLEVDETNEPAIALYTKLGFEKVGERTGYYQNASTKADQNRKNAWIMRLDLLASD